MLPLPNYVLRSFCLVGIDCNFVYLHEYIYNQLSVLYKAYPKSGKFSVERAQIECRNNDIWTKKTYVALKRYTRLYQSKV